jgi:hypothetical protein
MPEVWKLNYIAGDLMQITRITYLYSPDFTLKSSVA